MGCERNFALNPSILLALVRRADAKSNGVPLWDGKAKLRARMASPDVCRGQKNSGDLSDGVILVAMYSPDSRMRLHAHSRSGDRDF
jgi:hypothetical protein